MLIRDIEMRDVLITLAIALSTFLVAGLFYYSLRHLAYRMAAKTGTDLDNMLIGALEWPILAGIVLSGMYFSVLHLPWKESFDFEIRRGFHVAFLVLAAYGGAALVDALLRWFKLEVASKTAAHLSVGCDGRDPEKAGEGFGRRRH